jgi:hypothetical protein
VTELPRPVTRDQTFLAEIGSLLARQNELLADIRDRLPAPSDSGRPAPSSDTGGGAGEVELTEPARPAVPAAGDGGTEPLTEPAPASKPAARKPVAASKTTARKAPARKPRTDTTKKGT